MSSRSISSRQQKQPQDEDFCSVQRCATPIAAGNQENTRRGCCCNTKCSLRFESGVGSHPDPALGAGAAVPAFDAALQRQPLFGCLSKGASKGCCCDAAAAAAVMLLLLLSMLLQHLQFRGLNSCLLLLMGAREGPGPLKLLMRHPVVHRVLDL